jgi:phospholipid/cholesterol/gamma-HCH transport system ATP-binding protein
MVTVVDELVLDLRRRLRTTTVMTTHDLSSARAVASRVVLLFRGQVVADAPADRFFDLPHPAVRQFVEGSLHGPLLEPGGTEVKA